MLMFTLSYKYTMNFKQVIQVLAHCLCLLFFSNTLYADKSYIKCWKNAEGLTECGNRIPREYYSQRVRYIDDKGITRKVKEKVKTREELDKQLEIEQLLALEENQLRQSKDYDEVLLKTYLTIDDLLASLNSKLAIIESRGLVLESTLELKKRNFGNLVRKAADKERSGQSISKQLIQKLDTARSSLRNLQLLISTQEAETDKIQKIFAHDVERFMLTKSQRIKHSLSTPSQAKKVHAVRLTCLNQAQCDLHWQKANDFMKEFATTKVLYTTDKISVTDIPIKYKDIAMGLTILGSTSESKKMLIFQIRCNRERKGQEFCNSEDVNGLLKEFKNIVYK